MISYITISGIPNSATIQSIENLYKEIFGSIDHDKFTKRMTAEKLLSILAMEGDRIVGFKTGYGLDNEIFYSWIGGVLPAIANKA